MVEVFRTSVTEATDAAYLLVQLQKQFPACELNFDLSDCDRILRVAGGSVDTSVVVKVLKENGFHCDILE